MGNPSFPVVLTGDYSDGSVCSAEEYRADFEKLRDAVNFINGKANSFVFSGTEITYQNTATSYEPGIGDTSATTVGAFRTTHALGAGHTYKILNIVQVPPWTQGVRVRGLQLCNFSRLPNREDATWDGGVIPYTPNTTRPLEFGVAHSSDIADFAPDSANFDATEILSIQLDTDAKVRGPFQATFASFPGSSDDMTINIDPVFAEGTGYHSAEALIAVPPNDYLAIYATGTVDLGASVIAYDLNWHFHVNVLCDTMMPVL